MLKKTFILVCGICILLLASALHAQSKGDADRGRILAKGCVCHKNGFGSMKQSKFLNAIADFKAQKRGPQKMVNVAKGLSDADVADLAAFFTSK